MAENDFQRASMRGLGKKILLGDEPVEPISAPEPTTADDPALLKLTADEELDLLATVSAPMSTTPVHVAPKQQALPPLELDMPPVANLAGETLPLSDDLQSLITEAFETANQLSSIGNEAIPPLEDESASYIVLNSADVVLLPEVVALVDENFETWDESTHPVEPIPTSAPPADQPTYPPKSEPQPQPSASMPAPAERNEIGHMLPLIAGWVVAILVLIYQLLKDNDKNEKDKG
jgi:hypothetical protein